jgi:streptomycin 6-kinase
VTDFELPRNLAQAREASREDAPALREWITALPVIVDELAKRWALTVGRPFQPGGVASWVAPARTTAEEHRVLKVGWTHDEALHEIDGLRAWGGRGVVRLVDSLLLGQTTALLLEACEPGTVISDVLPPREQDVIAAGLLARLWIEPPEGHPFRSLQAMCDRWAEEFETKYAMRAGQLNIDQGLVRTGIGLFRELPRTAEHSVLLCTDLHPGNILAAEREPWLVIDPKPYVGDPTYDPLQYLLNFPDRLLADPRRFTQRMAGLLDLDAERLQLWLFARCVQESLEQPRLSRVAAELAP